MKLYRNREKENLREVREENKIFNKGFIVRGIDFMGEVRRWR